MIVAVKRNKNQKILKIIIVALLVFGGIYFYNDYRETVRINAEKQKIRGLLVAPSINEDAQELLNQEGIEFVSVEPPKELKTDKKVTLDIFQ